MKSIIDFLQPGGTSLVVIPPKGGQIPAIFRNRKVNSNLRKELLAGMQRFRGSIYLNDQAIMPQELTEDGRHSVPIDEDSWHVLTLRTDGSICACLRFLLQESGRGFDDLWVRHAALAKSPLWGAKLQKAVETEMAYARGEGLWFGEVGGWAIAPERRMTMEPLRTILATYGLLQLLGGCAGIATATLRHGSAPILRKIGLSPLFIDGLPLPAYYDPRYRCDMEVLRYDSRSPNPKFQNWVDELAAHLTSAPVIGDSRPVEIPRRDSCTLPLGATPQPALAGIF